MALALWLISEKSLRELIGRELLPLHLLHEQRCSIVDRLVLLFVFLKEYLCECTRMFFSSFSREQAAARSQSTFETVNLFPEFT